MEAQINKVLDTGLKPSHLDHHMSIYGHPADLVPPLSNCHVNIRFPCMYQGKEDTSCLLLKTIFIPYEDGDMYFQIHRWEFIRNGEQNLTLDFWKTRYTTTVFDH